MKKKTFLRAVVSSLTVAIFVFFLVSSSTSKVEAAPTVTHFWIGLGTGNWSDGVNWSLTDGGVSCGCVPGINDVAGFTSAANGVATINTPVFVNAMLFSPGYTGKFTNTNQNISIVTDLEVQTAATIDFGAGVWDIGDDVVLNSLGGSPVLNLNSANIFVGGDWVNMGGVINSGTSTVQFDGLGLNQNIFGNNTFYNVIIDPLSTKFFGLQENSITVFMGNLLVTGVNASNKVHIQTVNTGGVPVKKNATISPQGGVDFDFVTVQYNTNTGATIPLTSLNDEVVEIVPFSTVGWFPSRGPGGIVSNIETWSLANAVPLSDSLVRVSDGDSVRRFPSIFGDTSIEQDEVDKQPLFTSNAFNFNPALTFDGIDDVMVSVDGWTSKSYYIAVKPNLPIISNLGVTPSFFAPIAWLTPEFAPTPVGGFALGGNFTGTMGLELVTHAVGGGNGGIYRSAQTGPVNTVFYEDVPNVFGTVEDEAGEVQQIFGNGKRVDDRYHQTFLPFTNNKFFLGSFLILDATSPDGYSPCCFFTGQIGEIISFSEKNIETEREKIFSYLALKYGVTLDQSGGGQDYLSSNGNIEMWSTSENGSYNQDIAGIGQDNASALYQPKSRSVNKDSMITIGEPTDLENMEFMTWSNNGASYNIWLPYPYGPEGFERIQRVWRVSEVGDVGNTTLYLDAANLPATPGALYLLTSMDDSDFSNANTYRMIQIGGQWQLENPRNFVESEYFTIGYGVIEVEFKDSVLSSAENTPVEMTQVYVKGEVLNPISLSIFDVTVSLFGQPQGTSGVDYVFSNSPTITVPAGDYRTNVYPIDVELSITPDNLIENNEYTMFALTNLSSGVAVGDIDGDTVSQGTHQYVIVNDDSAGVVINPTNLEIGENDFGDYMIVLTSQVTVGTEVVIDIFFGPELENSQGSGVLVGQNIFTSDNWNIPQTISVWAQEDEDIEGVHFDTVTHAINNMTTDSNYATISDLQQVNVTIYDNDLPPDDTGSSGSGCVNPNGCLNQGDDDGDDVEILGCSDPDAVNYIPSATALNPDEPCLFVLGETDPPSGVNNYVEDALIGTGECPYFAGFYRLGSEGSMVARWQAFLNVLLGTSLTVDGKFGPSTDDAVREYHEQWSDIILRPWGHTTPTGYIYKTTNATGNSMIGCPLGSVFISETGEYFNADTYNSNYNLQALTQELRDALNIESAQINN